MGVCLKRTLVARIFAVVVCVKLRERFVLVKKCGRAREYSFLSECSEREGEVVR